MAKGLTKKQKNPIPTKKQEADFVKNLKPNEKVYTAFERPFWHTNGNWDGVVYDGWFKRLWSALNYVQLMTLIRKKWQQLGKKE